MATNRRDFLTRTVIGLLGLSVCKLHSPEPVVAASPVVGDVQIFEINGQTVFPIYGASGGLAAAYVSYLTVTRGDDRFVACVSWQPLPDGYLKGLIGQRAHEEMTKRSFDKIKADFLHRVNSGLARRFVPGGDLGLGGYQLSC